MFVITLVPQRRDDGYALAVRGEALVFDGAVLDLSGIPEGASLPAAAVDCPWLAPGSCLQRSGGALHLALILPHGPVPPQAAGAAQAVLFPTPLQVPGDGPVRLPCLPVPEDLE